MLSTKTNPNQKRRAVETRRKTEAVRVPRIRLLGMRGGAGEEGGRGGEGEGRGVRE